jgi:hypothetical protein
MNSFGVLVFSLLLFLSLPLKAEDKYWQQFVHYEMDVTLIPIEYALAGEETITYKNNSPDTLRSFYLHLYPNAYRDSQSIMAREARRYHQKIISDNDAAGHINVESFRIVQEAEGREVTAFRVDDTILEADLPAPLPPGGRLKVELSFYLKVRKFAGRAGYRGVQYDFAQWYPKVCVYDETGWNNEPFHLLGEFYGEFGTFDVTIRVPSEYIVAATGEVVSGDPGWESVRIDTSLSTSRLRSEIQRIRDAQRTAARSGQIRTVTFHAEHVHDFAWVISPDFLYERGEWDGIPVHVLYRSHVWTRWHKVVADRGERALEWLSAKFGRYPYPQLTIAHGLLRGGMEYPMLVMNASESETLIFHEVGHIYFFGILANNEWKEAWLDEGFTSFQTRWYMEARYGKWGFDRNAQLQRANWLQKRRPARTRRENDQDLALRYNASSFNQPISKISHRFNEPLGYTRNAYTKGAFFFDMLKYVVGDSTFGEICQTYYKQWAFKHVNEDRFRQVCEEVSGADLGWFFNQWLHDSVTVDYALANVDKKFDAEEWQTTIGVIRKARGVMPVDVRVVTLAGDTLTQRWDGKDRAGSLTFASASKPMKVVLDPNDMILDKARLNNGGLNYRLLFEYPSMSYSPRDTYVVTWRPSFWYNDVDKVRLGGRFKGRNGLSRNALFGIWFGTDSQELDAKFRYSNPVAVLGRETRGSLAIQKMEGRFEIDAHLSFVKSRLATVPPKHRFWFGFNHSKLLGGKGERYTMQSFDQLEDITVQTWEKGDVNKLYFRYSVDPRGQSWLSRLTTGVDLLENDWGSDFNYKFGFGELNFQVPFQTRGAYLRFYAGRIFDSADVPLQDMLFLNGANPREQFKHFFLRSNGSIPEQLHYHLPGGGNLRGYYNQPLMGDQIIAVNFEFRQQLDYGYIGRKLRSVFGLTSVVAFADMAEMEFLDSTEKFFANAGVGLRFEKILPDNWYTIITAGRRVTLRLDFPFWVSEPLDGEDAFHFRWLFGLEHAI